MTLLLDSVFTHETPLNVKREIERKFLSPDQKIAKFWRFWGLGSGV